MLWFGPEDSCLKDWDIFIEPFSPQGQSSFVPGFSGTHSDVVFFVNVLQELHIQTLVTHFGISKIAQVLRRETAGIRRRSDTINMTTVLLHIPFFFFKNMNAA